MEKRRSKRIPVEMHLSISTLFRQNNVSITDIDSPITVENISKEGIGFTSKSIFPLDYYFNAELKLGGDNSNLYCVIRIMRCEPLDNGEFSYGCQIVGLSPSLDYIFDDYSNKNNADSESANTDTDK